jgi:hypothetical protein
MARRKVLIVCGAQNKNPIRRWGLVLSMSNLLYYLLKQPFVQVPDHGR